MATAQERSPSKRRLLKRAQEESASPATKEWLAEVRQAVADGNIDDQIEAQAEPQAIVDEWRAERS
jgi:hypothetical protein